VLAVTTPSIGLMARHTFGTMHTTDVRWSKTGFRQ